MKKLFVTLALLTASSTFATQNSKFNGYIVKFKKDVKSLTSINAQKTLNTSFGNFAVISGSDKSFSDLKNDPSVEYVEPNWIVSINNTHESSDKEYTQRDTRFSAQWGLLNDGVNSGGWFSRGKQGEDINVVPAWEMTRGSKDLIVAVIDTGVDHRHPDLKDNMWTNQAELTGKPGIDDDGNGYIDDIYGYDFANKDGDPMDGHSHGTHCAGVIGASHNDQGIMGVMADVKIMGIKFLTDRGSGETIDAISSVEYAIRNGAHIMSNSWGGGESSMALKEAIEAANEAGIIFVAAAGNSNADNDAKSMYPAGYEVDNVISVGAMNGKGSKSSFSSYGQTTVHVFAPGSKILSTVKNGGYKKMSGTSMATPMVSGVLGLLLSQEPGMSPLEAKERLIETTVKNQTLSPYAVGGRVDSKRLLDNQAQ